MSSMRESKPSPEAMAQFAETRAVLAAFRERRPQVIAAGVEALQRLLPIAQDDTGQSGVVARFLLSLYNGNRFPFDLGDFRRLDIEVFEDCLAVLAMDFAPQKALHRYIEDGDEIFERLARAWKFRDFHSDNWRATQEPRR